MKRPLCAEQIQDEAIEYRYCGGMINGSASPPSTAASDAVAEKARGSS